MANPFVKGWKYLMALFGSKIDEHADPKVQIQQAIEDAQRQHQALVQQAAAVIGNQRQLEMKLSRQLTEVENLTTNARQALVLADKARADGDAHQGRRLRADRADVRHPAGRGRELAGGPQGAARPGARRRRPGPQGGREQRHDPAAEARRADQAAQPAGAGQDAGDRRPVAGVDELARRAGHHAVAGRGPRQDREAVRHRARPGRPRLELGRGPPARGPEGHPRPGRLVPAGGDPGQHGQPAVTAGRPSRRRDRRRRRRTARTPPPSWSPPPRRRRNRPSPPTLRLPASA